MRFPFLIKSPWPSSLLQCYLHLQPRRVLQVKGPFSETLILISTIRLHVAVRSEPESLSDCLRYDAGPPHNVGPTRTEIDLWLLFSPSQQTTDATRVGTSRTDDMGGVLSSQASFLIDRFGLG